MDNDKMREKSSNFSSIVLSNLILTLFKFGIVLSMIVPKNSIPNTKAKNKHGLRNIDIRIINIDNRILCDMTFLLFKYRLNCSQQTCYKVVEILFDLDV